MTQAAIGIYNFEIAGVGGAQRRTLAVAEHLSRKHRVVLITGEPHTAQFFNADLSRVEIARVTLPLTSRMLPPGGAALVETAAGWIRASSFRSLRDLKLDLFINFQWASNLQCPAPRGIYMCMFPHPLRGSRFRPPGVRGFIRNLVIGLPAKTLDTYDVVTANSEFTASWVRRMWNREAPVVYSAAEPMGPPAQKEKMILHVGRFTAEAWQYHKHQRALLAAFAAMPDLAAQGWSLHFAGALHDRPFSEDLMRQAGGLPVFFHFNASFSELRDLYRRSSIYWHATGLGWSPERDPVAQEHFGLTTVEAMSAGGVPVVINTAGQMETVEQGVSGFRWDDVEAMRGYTRQLANDPALWQRLSQNAIQSSERFTREAFVERVETLVDSLLTRP